MIIYKSTNIINNKVYIGQTIHPLHVRKSQHERSHEYGYKTAFSHVCAVCRGLRGSTKGNVYRYLDKEDKIIEPENSASIKES